MDLIKAQTVARDLADDAVRCYLLKLKGRPDKSIPFEIEMMVNGIEVGVARVDEFDPDVKVPTRICAGCEG